MAKTIEFDFKGKPASFTLNKVDRSALYGTKSTEVFDEEGGRCHLMTLAADGRTLVGKGGTGVGYLTADGNWCEKEQLIPVGVDGTAITPVPSSFASPIALDREVTIDHYLSHNIRLTYLLEPVSAEPTLIDKLKSGTLFGFPYSYRGGLEADDGFLMMNDEDEIFLLIGDETSVEFRAFQQSGAVVEVDEDDSEPSSDLMDFEMFS